MKLFSTKSKKAICLMASALLFSASFSSFAAESELPWFGWDSTQTYWYENGIKQGTYDDPQGVEGFDAASNTYIIRGREICDMGTSAWYWLDSEYAGAKATNKEVWMPYIYQEEANWSDEEIWANAYASGPMAKQVHDAICLHGKEGAGKWVRYDAKGRMIKGWYSVTGAEATNPRYKDQIGNTYYYDPQTGLMAKGKTTIDGVDYVFNELTGALIGEPPAMPITPATPVLPTIPTTGISVLEYGAIPNDSKSDVKAINKAIKAAMYSDEKCVIIPAGVFDIDPKDPEVIWLEDGITISMDKDTVLQVGAVEARSSEYYPIMIQDRKNVTLNGGTILGGRSKHIGEGELCYGINVFDSKNINIMNMTIAENWGDGIYLGTADISDAKYGCDNINIVNCTIRDNYRSNISIVDASNVIIDNCIIKDANGVAPQSGINIEPNRDSSDNIPEDSICDNITITNTKIHAAGYGTNSGQYYCFTNHYYPSRREVVTCRNVVISDCEFDGDAGNHSGKDVIIQKTKISRTFYNYSIHGTRLIQTQCGSITNL